MEKQIQKINIMIIIVYIILVLPYISQKNLLIFGNVFLRVLFIGIIVLAGIYDTLLAILLAVAFLFTHIKYQKINENFLTKEERAKIDQFINEK